MKLLKFKKIKMAKEAKFSYNLKRIGEINVKHMNINVNKKFWFTQDGAWYIHPKYNKRKFNWKKIKALAEGELLLSSKSGSEAEG